jgi:DNA-binding MarR family transcriptional regulator
MGSHTKPRRRREAAGELTSILDSIRRVVRVLRVASRAAEKQVGLSAAQVYVLHVLADGPAQSLNELAERTRTHQSSVSVVVQRLVDRGLVERTPVPGDARRLGLSLGDGAARVLRDAPDAPTELLIAALERMPAATRARLAGGLARLVKELGAADAPATMLFEDDAPPAAKPARAPRRRDGAMRATRRSVSS